MSEPSEILVQHLPAIERIVVAMCRRKGMDGGEIEEFSAEVKYRLVKDDYAVIRAFRERSSFLTYITAVVRHMLLDYYNHELGKWHDSAEALRLGPLAIDLARILYRERKSVHEALAILEPKHPGVTLKQLTELAAGLPQRMQRKRVAVSEAMGLTSASEDAMVRDDIAARISAIVRRFIAGLPEEDQLIVHLHFKSEMSAAQISRALHIDQQLLYRRLYKHFGNLRKLLEEGGFTKQDVETLIGNDTLFLDFQLKNGTLGPSDDCERTLASRREKSST